MPELVVSPPSSFVEDTRAVIVTQVLPKIVNRLENSCRWIGDGAFEVLKQLALHSKSPRAYTCCVVDVFACRENSSRHCRTSSSKDHHSAWSF